MRIFSSCLVLLLGTALGAGCVRDNNRTGGDLSDMGLPPIDIAATFADDGGMNTGPCGADNPCPVGQVCLNGVCMPEGAACNGYDDCQDDNYCRCESGGGDGDGGPCVNGMCVPFGTDNVVNDPDCVGSSFSAQAFKPPVLKCSWVEDMVLMTPLVIDLDRDNKPEIVFVSSREIIALNGKDCKVKWRFATTLHQYNSLAAADLDGDKFPEIVGVDSMGHVVVHDHNGVVLDTGTDMSGQGGQGVPLIVDIDNKAPPEIVVGGLVVRWVKGKGITTLYNGPAQGGYWGTASAAADLDGDGIPEIITGTQIYSMKKMAEITPQNYKDMLSANGTGAFPAIADFNKDGRPDIALAQQGHGNEVFYIYDWAAQKFIYGPVMATSSWNGAPAVADLDGDKIPDIAVTGSSFFRVLTLKCWNNPMAKGCEAKGILWSKAVRDTSGLSGPSAFDLNGDGKADVVYRDECFLRVLDGATGKTLFLAPVTSGTVLDYPVVADVDQDGHADVVVPSTPLSCAGEIDKDTGTQWVGPATQGILVYQDPMNRWMPSRAIWNEHVYHITNVNDNGTVPTKEAANWKSWNNFRQNVQGNLVAKPGVDYTGGKSASIDNGQMGCDTAERLWARLCNRGTTISPAGAAGTFYQGDPRMGAASICTATAADPINPGECADVYCDWPSPPGGPQDLWFRANDDGKMMGVFSECHPGNDLLYLPGTLCSGVG